MRILGLDVEGTYHGPKDPWLEGFYLTCCGLVVYEDGEKVSERVVWLDHNHILPTPGAADIIQMEVDKADYVAGHNLKYDTHGLMVYGVDFKKANLWDTMVAEYFLSGQDMYNRHFDLNSVCEFRGVKGKEGRDVIDAYWQSGVDTNEIPQEELALYQTQDCIAPIELLYIQQEEAHDVGMWKLLKLQMEFLHVLIEMEFNGIKFDMALAQSIYDKHKASADAIEEKMKELTGIPDLNMNSNVQKSALIYGGTINCTRMVWVQRTLKTKPETIYKETKEIYQVTTKGLGFPHPSNPKKLRGIPKEYKHRKYFKKEEIPELISKGAYWSVDKNTIADLPSRTEKLRKYKQMLLDYSKDVKIYETLFGEKEAGLINRMCKDGCIHPTLNQTVAKTGRLTSSNPNGQNLFPAVKVCFKPKYDFIAQHDLSQIEWRTAGELSHDQTMIDEVNSGIDQHVATLTELMGMSFISKDDPESKKRRNHAKVFNFRMIFGGSEWGFYLDINMPNYPIEQWRAIIKKFFQKYWRLAKFHEDNIKLVMDGFTLQIPTGRKFKFTKLIEEEGELTYNVNQIKNYPIQGGSADFLALMAVVIRRGMMKAGMKSEMILTVHDSLVFDVVASEAEALKNLCYGVSNSLREYIKSYFEIPWETYLEGEFEIGTDYKNLHFVAPNQKVSEVL